MDPRATERFTTGHRIRYHRERAHLTQQQLAALCPRHISQGRVSQWENGKLGVSPTNLRHLADALEIPMFLLHVPLTDDELAEDNDAA